MKTVQLTVGLNKKSGGYEVLVECPEIEFTKIIKMVDLNGKESFEEQEFVLTKALTKLCEYFISYSARTDLDHPFTQEARKIQTLSSGHDVESWAFKNRDFLKDCHRLSPKEQTS